MPPLPTRPRRRLELRTTSDDALREALAATIAEAVAAAGLTQTEAAERLGVDQPKISALVHGRVGGFSTDRLLRFLVALGHDVTIHVAPRPTTHRPARVEVDDRRRTMRLATAFETLARIVPGIGPYQDRESARELDKLVRLRATEALVAARRSLEPLTRRLARSKDLDLLDPIGRASSRLDRLATTFRTAARGYRAVFDRWKLTAAGLEALVAHDASVLERAEAIREQTRALADAPAADLEANLAALDGALDDLEHEFDARRWILLDEPLPSARS